MTDFEMIQKLVYEEYIKNSYLSSWTSQDKIIQKKLDIAELGLIITEVSEAMEKIRKKRINKKLLAIECADIIIRTLNFMSRKDMSGVFYIAYKNYKNVEREKLHGKEV